MASMNVSLPDPMRDYVQKRIDNGHYASVSDYVRDLIRRDQADSENEQRWLTALDASIEEAVQELDSGGGRELGAFCRELTAEIEAQGQSKPLR